MLGVLGFSTPSATFVSVTVVLLETVIPSTFASSFSILPEPEIATLPSATTVPTFALLVTSNFESLASLAIVTVSTSAFT